MIDLTPLDVRNKRGDFRKTLRGYDPEEVDIFLELVAERLEALVREVIKLRERAEILSEQVKNQSGREQAVQEALVTAQELRADIRGQAEREAGLVIQEAESAARHKLAEAEAEARAKLREAERRLDHGKDAMEEMERRRSRFLRTYRQLLERELDVVEVEEGRAPLEENPVDLDLGGFRARKDDDDAGDDTAIEEPSSGGEDDSTEYDPEKVDASAVVRPPIDALVDRLAEVYDHVEDGASPKDGTASSADVGGADEGSSADGHDPGDEAPRRGLFSLPDLPRPGSGKGEGTGWR